MNSATLGDVTQNVQDVTFHIWKRTAWTFLKISFLCVLQKKDACLVRHGVS